MAAVSEPAQVAANVPDLAGSSTTKSATLPEPPAPSAPRPSAAPLPSAAAGTAFMGRPILDGGLVVLLIVLTIFLASFAARNADILMDLATGRLILRGDYQFGVDPFSCNTKDVLWVNHAWLFDALVYSLYSMAGADPLVGGPTLIIFKVIVLVALVLILLRIRRSDQSLVVPVMCVGLAVLVMSQRMLLQSSCLSYLLLGLTIYVLMRPAPLWLLPVLFALWVNLDSWYILGPLTTAFFLLGSLVQSWTGHVPAHKAGRLACALLVGMAACLVNPHHYHGFQLPSELAYLILQMGDVLPSWMLAGGKTVQILRDHDPGFGLQWVSPFTHIWRTSVGLGGNVAGFAYFLFLVMGIASFMLSMLRAPAAPGEKREGLPWPRLLAWAFFALLSILQARLIPFFAIVGAPILVLNIEEYYARRAPARSPARARRGPVVAQLLTAVLLLGLLFLAWPGWLHTRIGDTRSPRRVTWELDVEPSLEKAAQRLGSLRGQGLIRHVFAFSPDVGCYLAWFAPDVKGYLDYRYPLFADAAGRYVGVKRELVRESRDVLDDILKGRRRHPADFPEWRSLTRALDIDCLILSNFTRSYRELAIYLHLDAAHWPDLYEDGRSLVFGWTKGPLSVAMRRERIDMNRLAFGAVPIERRVPPQGVILPERAADYWAKYLFGENKTPSAVSTVQQYRLLHEIFSRQWQGYVLAIWRAFDPYAFLQPRALATLSVPAGAPVLMMREARRAVAEDPTNPEAYLTLAQAADSMRQQEDLWAVPERLPNLRQTMRSIEAVTALHAYLTLEPNEPLVHKGLADRYFQEFHYLDAGLVHLGLAIKNWDRFIASATSGAERQVRMRAKKDLEAQYDAFAANIRKREEDFDLRAAGLPFLQRFDLALAKPYQSRKAGGAGAVDSRGYGLVLRALAILQHASRSQISNQERVAIAGNQVLVMLKLGRTREVNEALPSLKKMLGPFIVPFQFWAAAAAGDYVHADAALVERLEGIMLDKQMPLLLGLTAIATAPSRGCAEGAARALAFSYHQLRTGPVLRDAAEMALLRGLLALETGNTAKARQFFEDAIRYTGTGVFFSDRPIADHYLRLLRENR